MAYDEFTLCPHKQILKQKNPSNQYFSKWYLFQSDEYGDTFKTKEKNPGNLFSRTVIKLRYECNGNLKNFNIYNNGLISREELERIVSMNEKETSQKLVNALLNTRTLF